MQVEGTKLNGVFNLTPARLVDSHGFFSESWIRQRMTDMGFDIDWVQDNHSVSAEVNTGRGLLLDVAVDIRKGSPTYGRWTGVELSAENGRQLLIPTGFLHGFATREPETEILYKCSDYHASRLDAGNFVRTIAERQGQQIGSPKEVAFQQGWIDREHLAREAQKYDKNSYGEYLNALSEQPL